MKIAVVGSRTVSDYEFVKFILDQHVDADVDIIISGGANGADALGERYAYEFCSNDPVIFPANWKRFGRRAGFLRNQEIVDECDIVIAFHDGVSKGTKNTISLAKRADKPVLVFGCEVDPKTFEVLEYFTLDEDK